MIYYIIFSYLFMIGYVITSEEEFKYKLLSLITAPIFLSILLGSYLCSK